jgi:solute carrier family 35 protein C2
MAGSHDGFFTLLLFLVGSLLVGVILYVYYGYKIKSIPESKAEYNNILVGSYVCFWYCISISFTLFNKWILSHWEGGFEYPILTTSGHMIIKFILTRLWYCSAGTTVEPVSYGVMFWVIWPIGISTAIDVMLSNQSLIYITVPVYTIIKASSVVIVYALSLMFGLESFRCKLFLTVLMIAMGLGAAVYTKTSISVVGALFCLGAALFGALRWVLTQILILMDHQSENPYIALFHFSPVRYA